MDLRGPGGLGAGQPPVAPQVIPRPLLHPGQFGLTGMNMFRFTLILLLGLGTVSAPAQTNEALTAADLLGLGQQFLEENVDEDVLAQFEQVDEKKVQVLLQQLQSAFDQEYVLDLAAFKDAAEVGVTLLTAHPDTEPYAEWLRPRLDYFLTAQALATIVESDEITVQLFAIAERVAENREYAGLHYKSDTRAGKQLAELMLERVREAYLGRDFTLDEAGA